MGEFVAIFFIVCRSLNSSYDSGSWDDALSSVSQQTCKRCLSQIGDENSSVLGTEGRPKPAVHGGVTALPTNFCAMKISSPLTPEGSLLLLHKFSILFHDNVNFQNFPVEKSSMVICYYPEAGKTELTIHLYELEVVLFCNPRSLISSVRWIVPSLTPSRLGSMVDFGTTIMREEMSTIISVPAGPAVLVSSLTFFGPFTHFIPLENLHIEPVIREQACFPASFSF